MLLEVYRSPDAPAAHKETGHYNTWRETVAGMMAEDRSALSLPSLCCAPAVLNAPELPHASELPLMCAACSASSGLKLWVLR